MTRTAYKTFVDVRCSDRTTIALTESGAVYVMGDGFEGRLGLGDSNVVVAPTCLKISQAHRPQRIFCGHDCAGYISAKNSVFTWGNGEHGQLGNGQLKNKCSPERVCEDNSIVDANGGEGFSIFIDEDGSAYGCGLGSEGQLGSPDFSDVLNLRHIQTIGKVSSVSCGIHHSAFITKDDRVLVCGNGRKVPSIIHIEDVEDDAEDEDSPRRSRALLHERFKDTCCGFTECTLILTYLGHIVVLDKECGGFKFSVQSMTTKSGKQFSFQREIEINAGKYMAHRCSIMVLQRPNLKKRSLNSSENKNIIDIVEEEVNNDDLIALIENDKKSKKDVTVRFDEDPVTQIIWVEARKKQSSICVIL